MSTTIASLAHSGGPEGKDLQTPIGFPASLRGKKILLATESFGPVNGVSRTTLSLVTYLRSNDVQVAVVAPQYKDKRSRRSKIEDTELRLQGYPLPYNPDLTVAYPFRLDRVYARTFTPDVVYLASPASVGFQFLVQLRQLLAPPIILLNFQTDLSGYSEILFRPPIDRYAVWLLQTVQGFLFNHKAVHTIFYPSSGVRKYLEKSGAPANKMVRLGRGVDTELFHPSRLDDSYRAELAPNGEIILVCVARLAPEKGFEFLAQVAVRLEAAGLAFKLLIVGGNRNPAVEKEVYQFFKDLRKHVVFTGFLEGDALARAYASADLFLHCSITETFGLVVLESMASGVPVIARDEGGPSEIIDMDVSGYLIAPHDLDRFVTCTEEVAKNAALRRRLAVGARKQALETTWDKINNAVAQQLANALNERSQLNSSSEKQRASNDTSVAQTHPVWRPIIFHEGWMRFAASLVSALRVEAAIGLVFVFWNIAVVPLLVCGFVHSLR